MGILHRKRDLKCIITYLISRPTNAHIYNFYIKTFKIAPTYSDPKIIFRELRCSLLKSHFLKCDFSKEQLSSLMIETCSSDFNCFNVKIVYMCISWSTN